jgi:ribosomal protein L35AE/L33A
MSAIIQFLDNYGKPAKKPFKVSLFDISSGGISFGLKLNRRQEAAQLLGQGILMQTGYVLDGKKQKVTQKGKIVAAHLQPFGESSVHVQFEKNLPDDTMADIIKASGHPPEDS